jgi:hypothetical protein
MASMGKRCRIGFKLNARLTPNFPPSARPTRKPEFRCLRRSAIAEAVPTIVPAARQNSISRANASQLARSGKWKKVKDLRGKSRLDERRVSV